MSKKFTVSSVPKTVTPSYDAGDPAVQAKGFQLTQKSEGVDLHEPDRHYSFSKVSTGSAKSFLHPPDRLVVGRVIFRAKYLGHLIVKEPKGVPVVKAAVEKIKVASEVQRINEKDYEVPEVDLCMSIRTLTTIHRTTKEVLVQHTLPLISFSADVKRTKQEIFSYIAKTSPQAKEYICYAYEVPRGQGKQISATVSQAFELAFRKYQDAKEVQKQFLELKAKLEKAPPAEKDKIKKEIAALEAKKIAEEERLQRSREMIRKEAEARAKSNPVAPATQKAVSNPPPAKTPATAAVPKQPQPEKPKKEEPPPTQPEEKTEKEKLEQPVQPEPTEQASAPEPEPEPIQAEVQPDPAPPPVWKRGFDVALTTLEQQIKDLEEAFEWRKEMERKQRSLLGKDISEQYLAGIEGQVSQMPGNM